ncbi:MAG TPA: LptA/OstA family protein [Myxococcota bacterium]|nr:LptA/OstA family protein [Myxococcota bacterium]
MSAKPWHSLALCTLLLGSCGAEVAPAPRGEVGVAQFTVDGASKGLPDVATSIAQRLGGLGVGTVVPPAAVGPVAAEASTAERVELGDRTGARTLVVGSVKRVGEQIAVDARVLDLDSGKALGPPLAEQAKDAADVPRAVEALAQQIAARILAPPARAEDAPKPRKPKSDRDGKPREPIEIEADTLDAQTVAGGRRLQFAGHVNAIQGDVSLQCDGLDAFYPTGASEPDQLVAKGNVRVKQRDRTASCAEAVFYRSEDKLVCTGSPAELTEECNRAEAERITFYLETEKVEMLRGKVIGRDCEPGEAP